ncbi:hypothetical protein [Halobacillus massiliensis]|uniref:hypothetical protein n=1 Tax=Halobacillus massiliensis TaxID=1926286 RepID=UPI0009E4BB3B|nr:hypothetical protein [Halobacillus massiliensis]
MNWPVLKDVKIMTGFIVAILAGVFAFLTALYDIQYWVVFIVISFVSMFLSVYRADQVYKQNAGGSGD